MSSSATVQPATRSSKRNKRPSSPVLEFLSNARKKRGGGASGSKDLSKQAISATPVTPVTQVKPTESAPKVAEPILTPVAPTTQPTTVTVHPASSVSPPLQQRAVFPFKNPRYTHLTKASSNKKSKSWKSLKQILTTERTLQWKPEDVTYGCIDAPSSFKPAKKYSDLSGLQANYTDPQTKLRYANHQEFAQIRMLPSDIVTGLLSLRKANVEVP